MQSSRHLWESHLTCNGKPVYFNLRDPLQSIVASAAQLLGGLLPIHLTYSRAHKKISEDWTWSVGSSPLSSTSSGHNFGQIQIDILHRNYIISAIRETSTIVNQAVRQLSKAKTTPGNDFLMNSATLWKQIKKQKKLEKNPPSAMDMPVFQSQVGEKDIILLQRHHQHILNFIVKLWEEMGELEIELACSQLRDLLRISKQFESFVKLFVQKAQKTQCNPGGIIKSNGLFEWLKKLSENRQDEAPRMGFNVGYYIVSGIICSLLVIRRITSHRRSRPKVN